MVSDETKRAIALTLEKYNILQFGQFTLKSGIVSPFYIDMRILQSYPKALHIVAKVYSEILADLPQEVLLAGIPEAGIPLATAVGYEANRPLIQPRAKLKDHGKGKAIEGDWKPGDKVAIIDDLIAKGDSKIEALAQFKGCDLEVVGFYLLVDRELGGIELVKQAGYDVTAAVTISEVINILANENKLSETQRTEMLEFTQNN